MKRVLYFDAAAGVSGDMFVGALIDAGADFATIRKHLGLLRLDEFTVRTRQVEKQGITGTKFDVLDPRTGSPVDAPAGDGHGVHHHRPHEHRGLQEITRIIVDSALPRAIADHALAVFQLLAEAEATVHGVPVERVHFHEVGAVDCIVDIVAAASAFHQLAVDEAWCSPIHVGSGTVRCAHGELPVPAPATRELLRGVPTYATGLAGELATPTGAALLKYFCTRFGAMPPLLVERVGHGAGSKDFAIPNLLRVTVGRLQQ